MKTTYILSAAAIFFVSCFQPRKSSCITDFKETISREPNAKSIDFHSVSCFPWDTVMLLAPYHYYEQIREETGIVLPYNLSAADLDKAYFVFISQNKVQQIVPIERRNLDLGAYIRRRAFSNSYVLLSKDEMATVF